MPSSSSGVWAADVGVRVLWLTLFRTVATTLLLVVLAAQLLSRQRPEALGPADVGSFVIIGAVYVTTLATALVLRSRIPRRLLVWSQIVFDVALASSIVILTGGLESPFTFVYSLAIIGAALLLGRRGAVTAAALSVVSFAASVAVVSATSIVARPLSRLLLESATQLVAQFLIAALAGYLAEQLTRTGGQLTARERDLREITELQNRIVAAMPSGLVTCDAQNRVTFINPAGAAILGVEGGVRGASLDALIPGALRARGLRRAELRVQTASGQRTLGLSVVELEAGKGSLLIVFQDLTEVRRLETELERIDHLAGLGRMSATLAHEIRNPLASMRGSAQMLADDVRGTPQERLAQLIVRESDRLGSLVEGYLKLARPPAPSRREVRIDEVVAETVEMLRADPGTSRTRIEERLDPVSAMADAAQLKQALINLLRNALAATADGGSVRVSVREDNGAVIEVWDSAGAIAPEDRAHIFEPFFSRREGGTGLGLSTVQSIIHAHGGTIDVQSSAGTGTTFCLRLGRGEGT